MHLEKLFQLYLEQAKKRVLTLLDNERTRACQWIKKIELAPNPEEQVKKFQLHSLKLLLFCLESNCLIGPFEESPIDDKEFTLYDWDSYELSDFSNMIRSKKDKRERPEVSYVVSGNRRELVTYQDDQDTGQHCYYACSKRPIEEWKNLQSGVINNDSIAQWKERGELEELNRNESQNSSIDIPRCVMHTASFELDFNPNDERYSDRNPSRCRRVLNSSNKTNSVTPGTPKQRNSSRPFSERPETPQRFGGSGQQTRPYEIEQFGLSQNEQFRSPRGVFQNLDYDRFQTQRSPMPPRLTDEVIDSFDNARLRRGPLSEVKQNDDSKQQLCARLQKIRDGMNRKPQIEIQQEIEEEPEMVPYERITLQESCEDINSRHQETEQDLGILSEGEMDDEFGEHDTIDPKTIFKTKDENLVSRNVVKIETNTKINGNRREVTEEIMEQEDVNVVERTDEEDAREPSFKSTSNQQWKSKPRRVLADYSDLPQEDLENISRPSFQQGSFCQEEEGDQNRFYSGRQQDHSKNKSILTSSERTATEFEQLDNVSQPEFSTTIENSRLPAQVDTSERPERVEDVCQPGFASNLEDSVAWSIPEQGNMFSINQRNSQQVDQQAIRRESLPYGNEAESVYPHKFSSSANQRSRRRRDFGEVDNSERLENVSQPIYAFSMVNTIHRPFSQGEDSKKLDDIEQPEYQSFNDSTIKTKTSHRPHFRINTMEKLDQVSQPSFLYSTEASYQDSTRGTRCQTRQRPMPQVETLERIDQISHPRFMSSIENPNEDFTQRSRQRAIPQVDTSERLDQISHPSDFMDSFQGSMVPSIRQRAISPHRCLPQVESTERLDEVSQPEFLHSTGVSYQNSRKRTECARNQRPLPQVNTSEKIDQVSKPCFFSSIEDSEQRSKCPLSLRPFPQVDTSERLDRISNPCCDASFQNSTVQSKRGRCILSHRQLPQVNISERLDDVSQRGNLHSTEVSYQNSARGTRCPTIQRPLPQIETSERLDQVSHPKFLSSIEDTYQDSRRRGLCPSRPMPHVNTSERLDEVSEPCFEPSFQDSKVSCTRRRGQSPHRKLPQVEISERLDEVSQPANLHSTEVSYQDSTRGRTRCPTSRRLLPEMETSEGLEQVSQPRFLSSIEDTYKDSRSRCKCESSKRALPQVEISERLDHVSQPSCRDFSLQSRRSCGIPSYRLPPQIETRERLSQVSRPSYLTSFEDSSNCKRRQGDDSKMLDEVSQPEYEKSTMRSRGKRHTLVPGLLPHVNESEWLDDVCHPEYPSSLRTSSIQNTGTSKRNSIKTRLPPVDDSERLENICRPEFPSSFEDSIQQSRRETQNRNSIPQHNLSEKLDNISQPFCPTSFEDVIHSREEYVATPKISNELCQGNFSSKNNQAPKPLPQIDESEILDAVIQPDLTSFEDTGYGSHDKEIERLEDVSQPTFQSSYQDSTLRSRKNRLMPQERPLPFVDNSERLDDICQPDFPTSFETSNRSGQNMRHMQRFPLTESVESEKLENVCEPGFQSSLEDSNRRPNQSMHTPLRCSIQQSLQMSRRSKQSPRQRLQSKVGASEVLEDISQPFYSSFFEASMYDRESKHISNRRPSSRNVESNKICDNIKPQRPFSYVSESENLDNVTHPVFQSSFEDSRNTQSHSAAQGRPQKEIETSEELNDVSQQLFPTSFEDSTKNSRRCFETPKRKTMPVIDVSEKLEDICHHSFGPSFEDSSNISRRSKNIQLQRPLPQVDESEQLDEVSQPDFASTLKHSTAISKASRLHSSNAKDLENPYIEKSKQMSVSNRRSPQIDISERLNDISQPDFATSVESTIPRSMYPSEQRYSNQVRFSRQQKYPDINVSEQLDDVCQPSFPTSFEESTRYSRRNESRPTQRENSLDRSHRNTRRQFDTSELLENVAEPEFPSTFQDTMNISNERRRTGAGKRAMPQIDLSENIDSVCQPEFPASFEDSTTYRKNKNHVKNYPEENLAGISAPTFHSNNYEKSKQRSHVNSYLTQENLEDISCPSFQTTPKLPPRCHREDCQSRSGPPRQLFPRKKPNSEGIERPGDFRQVFESMPNYAPFEQQVVSKRNSIASRLKLPVTFAPTQLEATKKRQFAVPSNQHNTLPTVDFRAGRMRLPIVNQANPCLLQISKERNQMESRHPARTVSSTRIPLPPSARSQNNVQHQEQRAKIEKPSGNQERLVKKSSVKFHQTKSTYFKNKQDKTRRN